MAVHVQGQLGKAGVGVVIQIHGDAVEDFAEILLGQVVAAQVRLQGAADRVLRMAAEQPFQFSAPPVELGLGDAGVAAVLSDVGCFQVQGLQGVQGAALGLRQAQQAVMKIRAGLVGQVLAVVIGDCVGIHAGASPVAPTLWRTVAKWDEVGEWRIARRGPLLSPVVAGPVARHAGWAWLFVVLDITQQALFATAQLTGVDGGKWGILGTERLG